MYSLLKLTRYYYVLEVSSLFMHYMHRQAHEIPQLCTCICKWQFRNIHIFVSARVHKLCHLINIRFSLFLKTIKIFLSRVVSKVMHMTFQNKQLVCNRKQEDLLASSYVYCGDTSEATVMPPLAGKFSITSLDHVTVPFRDRNWSAAVLLSVTMHAMSAWQKDTCIKSKT